MHGRQLGSRSLAASVSLHPRGLIISRGANHAGRTTFLRYRYASLHAQIADRRHRRAADFTHRTRSGRWTDVCAGRGVNEALCRHDCDRKRFFDAMPSRSPSEMRLSNAASSPQVKVVEARIEMLRSFISKVISGRNVIAFESKFPIRLFAS